MHCSNNEKCSDENCTCGWGSGEHVGVVGSQLGYRTHATFRLPTEEESEAITGETTEASAEVFKSFKIVGDDLELQVIGYIVQAMSLLDEEYEQWSHTPEGQEALAESKSRITDYIVSRYWTA